MQISSQSNPVHLYQQQTDKKAQVEAQSQAAQVVQNAEAKTAPASAKVQGDSVTFSHDAKLLAEANRTASTDDGSRAEMVARLRERVQSGTYVPNERGIAEGIMHEDSTLFAM